MPTISELIQELEALEKKAGSLDELERKIEEKGKELALRTLECNRAAERMSKLSEEEMALHKAVQRTKAELTAAQNQLASLNADYNNLKRVVLKAVG